MNEEKSNPSKDKENIDRRKFLIKTGHWATGAACALGTVLTVRFFKPNTLVEIPPRFSAGSPDAFPRGSFMFNEEYRLFIVRENSGGFYAISSVCTHLGCLVIRNPDGEIACPCHGSTFDERGNALSGPAPRALDRYRMTLENGKLIVDTHHLVDEDQMILNI